MRKRTGKEEVKFSIRELKQEDLHNGFLKSLEELRPTSGLNSEEVLKIFKHLDSNPDYIIAVAQQDGQVVGAATLLIEHKFINNGGKVGHIEDVSVMAKYQGQGIGRSLMNYIINRADVMGCYKCILTCSNQKKSFYEKLGFYKHEKSMRLDMYPESFLIKTRS